MLIINSSNTKMKKNKKSLTLNSSCRNQKLKLKNYDCLFFKNNIIITNKFDQLEKAILSILFGSKSTISLQILN